MPARPQQDPRNDHHQDRRGRCSPAGAARDHTTTRRSAAGAYTVAVYTTVTDAAGRLVPDLDRDQFEVYDNGKLQKITTFANDIQPITVVMMLDRSVSMRQNFELVRKAAEAFVERLLPADKARIGSFSNRVQVDPREFTGDKNELHDILQTELQEEGPTPLWNAVERRDDGAAASSRDAGSSSSSPTGWTARCRAPHNITFGGQQARRAGRRDGLRDRPGRPDIIRSVGLVDVADMAAADTGAVDTGAADMAADTAAGWTGPILASRSSRRRAAEATSS